MSPLLIAAGEPSKIPFYIAGGVLVLWAIALAVLGLTRATFPDGVRGERAVVGGSVLLMFVTMAMAVITSAIPK